MRGMTLPYFSVQLAFWDLHCIAAGLAAILSELAVRIRKTNSQAL